MKLKIDFYMDGFCSGVFTIPDDFEKIKREDRREALEQTLKNHFEKTLHVKVKKIKIITAKYAKRN